MKYDTSKKLPVPLTLKRRVDAGNLILFPTAGVEMTFVPLDQLEAVGSFIRCEVDGDSLADIGVYDGDCILVEVVGEAELRELAGTKAICIIETPSGLPLAKRVVLNKGRLRLMSIIENDVHDVRPGSVRMVGKAVLLQRKVGASGFFGGAWSARSARGATGGAALPAMKFL